MPTQRELEMLEAARDAGITSRAEMANFMAQISVKTAAKKTPVKKAAARKSDFSDSAPF